MPEEAVYLDIRKLLSEKFGGVPSIQTRLLRVYRNREPDNRNDQIIVGDVRVDGIDRDWLRQFRNKAGRAGKIVFRTTQIERLYNWQSKITVVFFASGAGTNGTQV